MAREVRNNTATPTEVGFRPDAPVAPTRPKIKGLSFGKRFGASVVLTGVAAGALGGFGAKAGHESGSLQATGGSDKATTRLADAQTSHAPLSLKLDSQSGSFAGKVTVETPVKHTAYETPLAKANPAPLADKTESHTFKHGESVSKVVKQRMQDNLGHKPTDAQLLAGVAATDGLGGFKDIDEVRTGETKTILTSAAYGDVARAVDNQHSPEANAAADAVETAIKNNGYDHAEAKAKNLLDKLKINVPAPSAPAAQLGTAAPKGPDTVAGLPKPDLTAKTTDHELQQLTSVAVGNGSLFVKSLDKPTKSKNIWNKQKTENKLKKGGANLTSRSSVVLSQEYGKISPEVADSFNANKMKSGDKFVDHNLFVTKMYEHISALKVKDMQAIQQQHLLTPEAFQNLLTVWLENHRSNDMSPEEIKQGDRRLAEIEVLMLEQARQKSPEIQQLLTDLKNVLPGKLVEYMQNNPASAGIIQALFEKQHVFTVKHPLQGHSDPVFVMSGAELQDRGLLTAKVDKLGDEWQKHYEGIPQIQGEDVSPEVMDRHAEMALEDALKKETGNDKFDIESVDHDDWWDATWPWAAGVAGLALAGGAYAGAKGLRNYRRNRRASNTPSAAERRRLEQELRLTEIVTNLTQSIPVDVETYNTHREDSAAELSDYTHKNVNLYETAEIIRRLEADNRQLADEQHNNVTAEDLIRRLNDDLTNLRTTHQRTYRIAHLLNPRGDSYFGVRYDDDVNPLNRVRRSMDRVRRSMNRDNPSTNI